MRAEQQVARAAVTLGDRGLRDAGLVRHQLVVRPWPPVAVGDSPEAEPLVDILGET